MLEIVTGINIPFRCAPFQSSPQVTKTLPESVPILEQEVQNLLAKGAICEVPFTKDGFYSRLFLIPKKDGNMRPCSYRSEPPKLLYRNPPLSDGALNYSKVSPEARSFHDEVTSEGRVPFGGYTPSESKIRSIFMAKQSVPVPFSSIRSKYSTINVHPLNETSSRFLKKTGHPPSPAPGRYAHHRIDPTGDPSIHSDGHKSPGISGFYNKHREVGTNPNLDNHISWLYDQFDNNALHSALRKKEGKKRTGT